VLTGRGKWTIGVGLALYVVAWGFGTTALFPVATGLVAAPLIALGWVRFMRQPMRMRRRTEPVELVEGGTVAVRVEVRPDAGTVPAQGMLVERIVGVQERVVQLRRQGYVLHGAYELRGAPRGRFTLEAREVTFDDPFGLAEVAIDVHRADTLLVYPRISRLDGLFSDTGAASGDEGRALLHRTAGYDLHSIRDFQQGESLRRVHWRSTAKRRKLMVKELIETPRDEAAVLLDADRMAVAGPRGASSFDEQVRAAASLLQRMVSLGQRCSLVVHGASRQRFRIQAGGGEWAGVMAALAAVEPDAERPLASMLRDLVSGSGAAESVDAARLFVVTAAPSPGLSDRLLALRSSRRDVALVWVDAPTYAGRETRPGPEQAATLQLAAAGIPVARLVAGGDVAGALSATAIRKEAVHA